MPIVDSSEFTSTKFDYLVIGGGNAGLTLAARLSENPDITVGVIEAGTHDTDIPQITVPGLMGSTITDPKYDWTFYSVPQRHATKQPMLQPRGKGLGGSTLINFLGLSRANKDEYDAIERLGNPGWNWESMLQYMKKCENTITTPSDPPFRTPEECTGYMREVYDWNGRDGPVFKTFPTFQSDVQAKMFEVFEGLGLPWNSDGNNGDNIGVTTVLNTVDPRTMTRSSAYTAYFLPNAERKNLLVLTNAQVTKILLERSENELQRAVGAEFVVPGKDGQTLAVQDVRQDVILSAGTFQTPQLLELSGIGNPDILAKYGIECVVPLPGVGENLQDHICIRTLGELDKGCQTVDILIEPGQMEHHEKLYQEQKGFLTSISCVVYAFVPSGHLMNPEDISAWRTHATTKEGSSPVNNGLKKQYDILNKWIADNRQAQTEIINYAGHQGVGGLKPVLGKRYTTFTAVVMHPLSRGTVHIASSDPLASPEIDPNYFANEGDLDVLLKGLKYILDLYSASPLKDLVKEVLVPPAAVVETGETLKEWIRQDCTHVYHPVGTAAMMPHDDGGVVDSTLKVYGTHNLRVVDCSILPLEMACHTQSIAYAIGEKAADIIKAEGCL